MWPANLRRYACLAFLVVGVGGSAILTAAALGQEASEDVDTELQRERQIVERFVTVLERNPRRGTALDRIYGHHVEAGTLDQLVQQFTDRTAKNPQDGTAWMILGLVESQRGRDAAAVAAFQKAAELRGDDPMAAFYLGQSLILVGQPEQAVTAFEKALERKPVQADLLSIYQALGRVHQQAQQVDKALAVWSRLEKQFPNDPRVQEDIATTLVEEGQFADALSRYEALARQTTDDYRMTMYRMQAADLKIKTNRAAEGIADLESLLKTLNPQNWLFREVRHQIEEVYLRTSDDDGLVKYYEKWLKDNAEDVDAMGRVARVLARQGRVPEAQTWLDQALKLAPSRKELRTAFIDQLVDQQQYAVAIGQYAELDKVDPNNPDYLRNWGKLILRDTARAKPERQAEAEKVWRRMMAARPTDPLIAAQVADLFRYAEMPEQALELYQKAVELAPNAPQYREYLGEYYHILKRPEEAQATWRKLAEGSQRTAANVARLAEVFAQFGYLEQAQPEIAEACRLDPKDFALQLKAAEMQVRGEKLTDSLASLERSAQLAQNDEEREAVLAQQIKVYGLDGSLEKRINDLVEQTGGNKATAEQWYLLARFQEERREYPEATVAIRKAHELDEKSIRYLAAAARIAEASGELEQASAEHRKLAVLDRRGRTEHLRHVAELESQLGRIDEALAAGRDLIAAAPGNVDTHQFFADLCFRLGKPEEALATLRRAVRANPNDENILLTLASALATQFRTDEAIELYWQAFEKSAELDDKLSVVGKLAELYLQTNHFDRLLERLERMRQEAEERREMTICLAQAHQSSGDFGMARQELERLLSENSRDTQLLQQLSKLAEAESDLTSAVSFQEQVAQAAPGPEAEYRLATLLSRAGRSQEAAEILVRLTANEEDHEKLLRNIDGLLAAQEYETALNAIEPKLRENPKDWELLYREGAALFDARPQEAAARFRALLALEISDDEPSTATKNRELAAKKNANSTSANTYREVAFARLDRAYEVQRAIGINSDYYSLSQRSAFWSPNRFGQARMAALGWLYRIAQNAGDSQALVDEVRKPAEAAEAPARALWDWVYLESVRGSQQQELLTFARRLARADDLAGHYLHLSQLASRNAQVLQASRRGVGEAKDTVPPLAAEELELVKQSFEAVERALTAANQINLNYLRVHFGQSMMVELKRAGRADEARQMYQKTLDSAKTAMELAGVLQLAIYESDTQSTLDALDRFAKRDLQEQGTKTAAAMSAATRQGVAQILGAAILQMKMEQPAVSQILDHYLTYQASSANRRRKDPRNARTSRRSTQSNRVLVATASGGYTNMQLSYPLPNQYFDNGDITLLRAAYDWFKKSDVSSDLVAYLDKRSREAAAGEKIYAALALAYVQAWNEDTTAAVKAALTAAELEPHDADLRLDLAQLCLQTQQLEEALTQLDAIAPINQNTLREREMLALDVAVRLGDLQRARQAAQRLFGLRLDAETQLDLAGKMRRLGMNAEAEAILARAQRHAGSSLATLAALLGQYLSQGKSELASEVAHQILRRSRTAPSAQVVMGYSTSDSNYRTAALQCLAQNGKLKEIIARVEQQLERSPRSTQLAETLAEYYTAAGDTKKSLELQGKIIDAHPADADLRFRYAQLLMNNNKSDQACEQYKLALKKKPALLQNRSYDVLRAFQQAKREVELAKFIGELDIKGMNNPYGLMDLIRNLFQNRDQREAGLALLRKAWDAYPAQRSQLLQSFYDDAIWKTPEVYEFGRQSLLPTAEAIKQLPWTGVDVIMSYSQDGRANTVLEKVLAAAAGNRQLEKLRADVAAHAEKNPDWLGGKLLVGLIDLRLKRPIDVRATVKPLIDAPINDYRMTQVRWIVGQELESHPEYRELVIDLYKGAVESEQFRNQQFQYSPGPKLVKAYLANNQREEARKLLVSAVRDQRFENYDPSYASYMRVETAQTVARQMQEAEFTVDALRVYRDLVTDMSINAATLSQYGRDLSAVRKEAQSKMDAIIAQLKGEAGTAAALELLAPREKVGPSESAIDLLVTTTQTGDLPRIDSLAERFVQSADLSPENRDALLTKMTALAEVRPQDMSVAVTQGLLAASSTDAGRTGEVFARIAKLLDDVPLEELPADQRANSRQREVAARQIPLWLLARACLKKSETRELGLRLADRAVEATTRQTDPSLVAATLHERGQIALDGGNPAEAEKDWNQLIDLAIVLPRQQITRRATDAAAAPPNANAPQAVVASQTPPGATPKALPVTLSQFKLGAGLSELAARHNMPALSLRAVREVVSGGLPVPDVVPVSNAQQMTIRSRTTAAAATTRSNVDLQIYQELATRMWQVSNTWEKQGVSGEDVCQLLEQLVFPANRPGEVLLFEQPMGTDWSAPRSVGALLAAWAQRTGRSEAVVKQVAARRASPTDELSGHVLLAQLYLAAKDLEGVRGELNAIGQLVDAGRLGGWAGTAAHAIGPAFNEPTLAKEAAPLMTKAIGQLNDLASGYNSPPASSPVTRVVRHYLATNDLPAAKRVIDAYFTRRQAEYARYGGDSPLTMQRADYTWAANELCRGNDLQTTLDAVAKVVDSPSLSRAMQLSLTRALNYLARQLSTLPPAERYEKLHVWTLPVENRRSVRAVVIIDGGQPVPNAFLSEGDIRFDPRPAFAPMSNLTLLVDAAREAGKLDELWSENEALIKEKVGGAEALGLLLAIAREDEKTVGKRIQQLVATYRRDLALNRSASANDWTPVVIAYAALQSPKTAASGETLLGLLVELTQNDRTTLRSWLSYGAAQHETRGAGKGDRLAVSPLKHWVIADSARTSSSMGPPAVWAAAEGHVKRICGSELDELFLRYPISGDFELTAEALIGDGQLCNFAYGGIGYLPSTDEQLTVQSLAGNDTLRRGLRVSSANSTANTRTYWHRFSLRVADGKARFALNGWPVFEDRATSPTSPWFGVFGLGNRHLSLRNVTLRGTPTIPRVVRLVDGSRLEGWASAFGRTMPPSTTLAATLAENRAESGLSESRQSQASSATYDWFAEDGVLAGRSTSGQLSSSKAWLHYHRPLLDGETLRYQFHYRPGELEVHPTCGRIAFLFDPTGLRLQWLEPAGVSSGLVALAGDAIIEDTACRRVPVGEALKANDWNDVELSHHENVLTIRLNGQAVCERPLDSPGDSYFGFYHVADQSAAEIRNVELAGSWPETLDAAELENLLATRDDLSPGARQAAARLVGERLIGENAGKVWERMQGLDDAARYQQLKAWVVPSEGHVSFRTQAGTAAEGVRVQPALDLAEIAKRTNQLDDLASAIEKGKTSAPKDELGAAALEALVAIARGDAPAATARLELLERKLSQHVQDARGDWPHAELLAAEAAVSDPLLREAGRKLAEKMATMANNQQLNRTDWQRVASALVDRALTASASDAAAKRRPLAQWQPVEQATAWSQAGGFPASEWHVADDRVRYFASGEHAALYFSVPLRGDFEVRFEQQPSRQRGLSIRYAGRSFNLSGDGRLLVREQTGLDATTNKLTAKLPKEPEWNEYRLVVQGDKMTALVNGVEIVSETIPADRDPWLALATSRFNRLGAIRRVQISGQPSIPDEIALTHELTLTGWHADYFGEPFSPDGLPGQEGTAPASWSKQAEEIVASQVPHTDGTHRESLLQYHRPLREDGVVEYEFYWETGKTACHPALGGVAYLLSPEGAKQHRLTRGALERSDLAADNVAGLTGASPVPLKEASWNRAVLSLKGNALTISVNDQQVAQVELDPLGDRTFGLFHYRDASGVRVRNVVQRGSWPRQLPSVEQQELATPPATAEARAGGN